MSNGETKYETREVLAGAYTRKADRELTHVVEVIDGSDVRVLCERVELDNLVDHYGADDLTATPSCNTCRARCRALTSK